MKLIAKCLVHNFDMYSDWLYLLTVPAYTTSIKFLIATFIALPIIIIIGGGRCSKYKLSWIEICAGIFGLGPLYEIYFNKMRDMKKINSEINGQAFLFLIEDGPQLVL